MGRRVVPQVVERPKYYFERVPGGQWNRVDSRFPTAPAQLVCPLWYHGLIYDTSIALKLATQPTETTSIVFGFGEDRHGNPLVQLLARAKSSQSFFLFDGLHYDSLEARIAACELPKIWGNNNASELFDKIVISSSLPLENATIRLNNEMILWEPATIAPLYTGPGQFKYDLSDAIRDSRNRALPDSARHNRVLVKAASEFGKCWNPKYGGPWYRTSSGDWEGEPYGWCEYFAVWVVRSATALKGPGMPDIGGRGLASYFKNPANGSRWIGPPQSGETDLWSRLGKLIHPGYYVLMKQGGHAGFFVQWETRNPNGSGSVGFYPELDTNYFRTIEGCWGSRVQYVTRTISKTTDGGDLPHIYWKPQLPTGAANPDGFGITSEHFDYSPLEP